MIHIFLETGKQSTSEYVFIDTLLKKIGLSHNVIIETVNGKDNLAKAKNAFVTNTLEGGTNLIIFDADTPLNEGGFKERQKNLLQKLDELEITAELFLFPNNHDDGCFEDLLLKIALFDRYKTFFDCFGDYEKCLGDKYAHPNLKGKIFSYISSMKSLTNNQRDHLGQGKWLFDNADYWDLDNDALLPLKEFLLHWITEDNSNTSVFTT